MSYTYQDLFDLKNTEQSYNGFNNFKEYKRVLSIKLRGKDLSEQINASTNKPLYDVIHAYKNSSDDLDTKLQELVQSTKTPPPQPPQTPPAPPPPPPVTITAWSATCILSSSASKIATAKNITTTTE